MTNFGFSSGKTACDKPKFVVLLAIMCRNIKQLHNFAPPATDEEIRTAAVQFVRKIGGFNKPSAVNAKAFETAVEEITKTSKKLLESLTTNAPPKDREIEREKARERNRHRFGAA